MVLYATKMVHYKISKEPFLAHHQCVHLLNWKVLGPLSLCSAQPKIKHLKHNYHLVFLCAKHTSSFI